MINALEVSIDLDLSAFVQFLRTSGVPCRVTEEGLNQVIWVASDAEVSFVQSAYARFREGQLPVDRLPEGESTNVTGRVVLAFLRFPFTLLLILVAVLMAPSGMAIDSGSVGPVARAMLFLGTSEVGGVYLFMTLGETLAAGEYWRLVSPMFIHFSILHLVFNMLWVWEIGRRIEFENGAWLFLTVVLVSSVAGNLLQYLMTGPGLFGGMSGVVFGLLGFALAWSQLVPERSHRVQNGIYIFMLVYLAIGFTGAVDMLGLGSLANGAHLGGLLGGAVTAGLAALLARQAPSRRS